MDEDVKHEQKGKQKFTNEERELKLKQMSANAQWRQETRYTNVQKYKDDDKIDDIEVQSGHASAKEAIKYVVVIFNRL